MYSNFRLDEPKISKWLKQEDYILKPATPEHKNLLKTRQLVKCNALFDQLKIVFDEDK